MSDNITSTAIPSNPAAHARIWWNSNHGPDEQIKERGVVAQDVIIAWTIAGMPVSENVVPRGSKSNYKFNTGELAIFRAWCEETERDPKSESSRAAWFEQEKPQPKHFGPTAIVAIITARKINKDGSLSKAKSIDFYVERQELDAVRTNQRGKIPALDYVRAISDQLENHAPVRIVTKNERGEGDTHTLIVETGEDGSDFIPTANAWVNSGNLARQRAEEEARAAEEAKREAEAAKDKTIADQAEAIAEMQAKLDALLAAQNN